MDRALPSVTLVIAVSKCSTAAVENVFVCSAHGARNVRSSLSRNVL